MCSGKGTPGNRTTDSGKSGSSLTPLTMSLASLINRYLRNRFGLCEGVIIADGQGEVSMKAGGGTKDSGLRSQNSGVRIHDRINLMLAPES